MDRPRRVLPHLPSRPTWRCQSCGIAWPCSPAKLRLLGEYRENRTALMVYLATLKAEAAEHLAELDSSTPPADLDRRFLHWATPVL
ncbi:MULTISPECIES: flavin reductase [Micromonospora]|uniref:Flavin reductase n=1 Tax=Micromonospora reichwaldensis TaxID=3075516 RepID=A0ABU2X359_9ACTN|nr:flavin reductase [Micromonospora sp. DSM 115977]MDT0532638.1 flavin reductase [Micromonospora sp. DSM 115977]